VVNPFLVIVKRMVCLSWACVVNGMAKKIAKQSSPDCGVA
jgi:hypothetical protein